jgi:hypothetical protein
MVAQKVEFACVQVFDMFAYVKLEDDPRAAPPAHPNTGWRERYSARQRIGGLVLVYARAAGQVQHNDTFRDPPAEEQHVLQIPTDKKCITMEEKPARIAVAFRAMSAMWREGGL